MQTLSTAWTETGDIHINIHYHNGKRKEEEVDTGEGNVKKIIFLCHVEWCLKLKNKNRQANHVVYKHGDKLVKRTWRLKNGRLESGYLWGRELGKGWTRKGIFNDKSWLFTLWMFVLLRTYIKYIWYIPDLVYIFIKMKIAISINKNIKMNKWMSLENKERFSKTMKISKIHSQWSIKGKRTIYHGFPLSQVLHCSRNTVLDICLDKLCFLYS